MAGNRGGKHGEITGKVGVAPPPGAPIETAQPVDQSWVNEAARLARINEKELPAFDPRPAGGGAPSEQAVRAREVDALQGGFARGRQRPRPSVATPAAGAIILTDHAADVPSADVALVKPNGEPAVMTVHPPEAALNPETRAALVSMGEAVMRAQHAVDVEEAAGVERAMGKLLVDDVARAEAAAADAPAPENITPPPVERPAADSKLVAAARDLLSHRVRTSQPAASNTDTPSRGIPHSVADPGKQITGGFGEAIEAQYFPLDGNELREVVYGLMDKLAEQIKNDLRFSIAVVYPRVSAKVTISIDCYAKEMSFEIPKREDVQKTPIDVALAMGAEPTTIALENDIAEFSPDGQSLVPPNTMRKTLGLEVPRKQRVSTPTGYAIVDRVSG